MARTELDILDLYQRHSKALLVFLVRRTADPDVGRDIWAETFAQAVAARRDFRGTTDAEAVGWLYAIARNQLSRYYRKGLVEQRMVQRLGLQPPELAPEVERELVRSAALADLRGALKDAIASLSEETRSAVMLRVVDERSYAEVAERLGINETAARARVSRGLRALAEVLDVEDTWEAAGT
jgi:RNA polymerase sigma factor (sigma-70 family)